MTGSGSSSSSWDIQGDLISGTAIGRRPCVNETGGDGVGMNTKRTPLIGEGFSETNNNRFCGGVVDMPNVSVETRGRGNVDDGTVLRATLIQYERHIGCLRVMVRWVWREIRYGKIYRPAERRSSFAQATITSHVRRVLLRSKSLFLPAKELPNGLRWGESTGTFCHQPRRV